MRRAAVASALAVAACVSAETPARAQEPVKYFLEGTAGVGITSGVRSSPSTDYLRRPYLDHRSLAGPVADFSMTHGIGWKNLGFGVALDGMFMQSFWKISNGASALQLSASAVLLFRFDESGVSGEVALGKAWRSESTCESVQDFSGGASSECLDSSSGPRFAMGLGYQWPIGAGVRVTGSYAYLTEGDALYRPLTMVVQGTWSSW